MKLLAMPGLGRGTMVPLTFQCGRSDDPRMLFASPVRPLLPPTMLNTTPRTTLAGESPRSPIKGMILDVSVLLLGNNLCFLGRMGLPRESSCISSNSSSSLPSGSGSSS